MCVHAYLWKSENSFWQSILLPPYRGRFSSVVSTVLYCVVQAGWPVSFWEILLSLLSIFPYECWNADVCHTIQLFSSSFISSLRVLYMF